MIKYFLTVLALVIWIGNADAHTYKYTNSKGTPCFTNDTCNIPKEYKKSAVLISKDEDRSEPAALPMTDIIDKSLLPQKEEVSYKTDTNTNPASHDVEPQSLDFPFMNVAIISSMFVAALISAVFVDNRIFKKILNIASLACMITLLVYVSTFFVSKHMKTLKKAATEMTDTMNKKEAQKEKALQEAAGHQPSADSQ